MFGAEWARNPISQMFSYPSYCEHTYPQDLAKLPNNLTALFAWICPDLVILAEGVGVSLRYLVQGRTQDEIYSERALSADSGWPSSLSRKDIVVG